MYQMGDNCEFTSRIETRCRLCLQNKGVPFDLFESPKSKNFKGLTYWDILNKICRIKTVNKGDIPQKICMLCARDVKKCYSFITLCESSDKTLQEEMNFVDLTEEIPDLKSVSEKTVIENENSFNVNKINVLPGNENSVITENNENPDVRVDIVEKNSEEETAVVVEAKFKDENFEMIENNFSSTDNDDVYDTSSNPLTVCEVCRIKFETETEYEQHMKTQHDLAISAQTTVLLNISQKVPINQKTKEITASTKLLNKTQHNLITSTESIDFVNNLETDLINKVSASKELKNIDSDNNSSSNDNDSSTHSKNALRRGNSLTNKIKSSTGFLKISDNLNLIISRDLKWKADADKSREKNKKKPSTRKCLYCEKTCTLKGYITHLKETHPDQKIGCSYCEKIYFRPKALLNHIKENHPGEKIDCTLCDFSTEIHGLYYEHMMENHQEIFSERKCEFCDYTTISAVRLGKHMTKEHDDKKQFKCNLCEKKFFTRGRKTTHQKAHAREHVRFFCEICGKSYKHSTDLKNHMDGHKNDKTIECNICHKKFNRIDHYAIHKRYHVNDQQYQCNECGNIFKHKFTLRKHIDTVHKDIRKHKCMICEKKFIRPGQLRLHKKRHSPMTDLKCEVCGKMFVRNLEFKQHSAMHTQVCEVSD